MTDFKKKHTITSPKGIAKWPKLITPDTKFKEDGEYSVKLLIADDACREFREEILKAHDVAYQAFISDAATLAKFKVSAKQLKIADLPFKESLNDMGESTGTYEFKFSLPAKVTKKDGTTMVLTFPIFDAAGVPVKGEQRVALNIGSGSVLRVNCEVRDYFTKMVGFGVKLSICAVQIVDLVQWSGANRSAEDHGFIAEGTFSAAEVDIDEAVSVENVTSASNAQASDF